MGESVCTEVLRWDFIFSLPNFTHSWSRDFIFFEPETSHVPGPTPRRNLSLLIAKWYSQRCTGQKEILPSWVFSLLGVEDKPAGLVLGQSREKKSQETPDPLPSAGSTSNQRQGRKGSPSCHIRCWLVGSIGGRGHQARPGSLDCAHSLPGWASQILSAKRLSPPRSPFSCLGGLLYTVCGVSLSVTLSTKKPASGFMCTS